jgi:hypothetical protein
MLGNLIRWIFVGLFLTVCVRGTSTIFYTEGGVPPALQTASVAPNRVFMADGGDPVPPLCPRNPCPKANRERLVADGGAPFPPLCPKNPCPTGMAGN